MPAGGFAIADMLYTNCKNGLVEELDRRAEPKGKREGKRILRKEIPMNPQDKLSYLALAFALLLVRNGKCSEAEALSLVPLTERVRQLVQPPVGTG
jgi:hypothetical protein